MRDSYLPRLLFFHFYKVEVGGQKTLTPKLLKMVYRFPTWRDQRDWTARGVPLRHPEETHAGPGFARRQEVDRDN